MKIGQQRVASDRLGNAQRSLFEEGLSLSFDRHERLDPEKSLRYGVDSDIFTPLPHPYVLDPTIF
jgi:hypothetical protein